MKIAFVTDIHVHEPRLSEQVFVLDRAALEIANFHPDVVLVGGDLTGFSVPHRATPAERNSLVKFFLELARAAPVHICRGNHDYLGDWDFLNHVSSTHKMYYYVDCTGVTLSSECSLAVLPWLDRTTVRTENWADGVRARYAQVLDVPMSATRFVLSHLAVEGSSVKLGQPALATADPVIPASAFVNARACFFGHYHEPQSISGLADARYGGSLMQNEFGESRNRGWWSWDDGKAEHHVVPGIERVAVEIDGANLDAVVSLVTSGHLKIVVRATPEALEAAKAYADALASKSGAKSVSIELRVNRPARTRDGAGEVSSAKTIADKIKEYASRCEPLPDANTLSRSLELLTSIEEN